MDRTQIGVGPNPAKLTPASRGALIDKELAGLKLELEGAGIKFHDWGGHVLIGRKQHAVAVPILLRHLNLPYSDWAKACFAIHLRARFPEVRNVWSEMAEAYKDALGDETKMSLANVLIVAYTNECLNDLVALLRDKRNGETRIILLTPLLRRKKNREVFAILRDLKSDEDLAVELEAKGI